MTISYVTLYAERIHILQRDCLLCTIWLFVYVTMLRCNNVTNQLYKFMTMPWWDPKMCYIHPCDNFICDMSCWQDIYIYYRDCLVCTIWQRVYLTMLLRNNVTVQLYNFIANHTTPHPPHNTTPITPHHNNPAHTTSHFTTLSTYLLLIAMTL